MTGYDLPFVNACLNGTATVLLLVGYVAIRTGGVRLHKAAMLSALAISATFLTSYLYYHLIVRGGKSTEYAGDGRSIYLAILLSHIVLAAACAPMAVVTAVLGLRGRHVWHRRIARVTLPIWLYVSVTGVVVYLFLKDLYPKG